LAVFVTQVPGSLKRDPGISRFGWLNDNLLLVSLYYCAITIAGIADPYVEQYQFGDATDRNATIVQTA
jgi:hypothetical protein